MTPEQRYRELHELTDGYKKRNSIRHHFIRNMQEIRVEGMIEERQKWFNEIGVMESITDYKKRVRDEALEDAAGIAFNSCEKTHENCKRICTCARKIRALKSK